MSSPAPKRSLLREAFAWGELRRTPYGIRPAAIFATLTFFGAFGGRIFSVAGPNIAQDVGLDLRTFAGLVAVIGTLGIVATLYIGWLADRRKRTRLAGGGLVASGLASIVQSQATNTGTYSAGAVAGTVTGSVAGVPTFSLLADYYPVGARGRVFALLVMVGRAASVMSLLIVGLMVTVVGWRTTTVIAAVPLVVLGMVVLLFMREPVRGYFERKQMGLDEEAAQREDPPQSFGEGWRTIWSVRMVRRIFIAQIFSEIGTTPFSLFLPFMLAEVYGLNALERSMVAFPTVLAGLFGGVLSGGLIDVLGRRSPSSVLRILGAMNGIPVVGLLVLIPQPPLWVAVAGMMIVAFGSTVIAPAFLSIYSQVIPAQVRSQGVQITNLAEIPSLILVGMVFGSVVTLYGYSAMFALSIPFILVMAVIMVSAADFFEGDRRNAIVAAAAGQEARAATESGAQKLLVCRDVRVSYEGNEVLFGVDFDVEEGEIVALLGTNGAGKSTLLRAISGTQEASDGAIVFDGRDTTHMPPHEIAGRGVVHMPGGRGVFPGLTVEENLKLATWLAPDGQAADKLLSDAYELFPVLRDRRSQRAGLLSGGEQQMLSLAQAFMTKPKLLMIDELSLGLAPAVVAELVELVKEINRRGTTVVVVEQSINVALTIAQRAVFMEKGEVRFAGPTAELLRRPDVLRAVYVKGTATVGRAAGPRTRDLSSARVVLEATGITRSFGGIKALDGVDLTLRQGEILGVIGPNGSGKTTLFDILSGYQRADAGTILFEGVDVTSMPAHERARLGLVRRFQDARLFPSLTVTESILVALDQGLEDRNLATATAGLRGSRRSERRARVKADRIIELLDLGAQRDKFVKELSTGLRRIADVAWVLATEPKVLLLDEPSSGVAQSEAESLAPLFRRVSAETGCSILIVEHDVPLVTNLADELIVMASGRVLARGQASEVLESDEVVEAFLGTSEEIVKRSGALT